MKEFFDDRERSFLQEIKHNIAWKSVIRKLTEHRKTPRYNPLKDKDNLRWVYESGRLDELDAIVSLLTMENVNGK